MSDQPKPKPITQFSYRSQKELAVWKGYPDFKESDGFEKPSEGSRLFHYSKYGHVYAYLTKESLKAYDASTFESLCDISRANIIDFWLSPKGSYVATWERPTKLEDGSGSNNLIIWDTKTGEEIASFSQKAQTNMNFQWTDDEKYCAHMVTGEIHFWESEKVGGEIWRKLKQEGIAQFSLSPGKSPSVAVFVPEKNGAPAIVRMYSIPSFDKPTSKKTFFKADRVTMYWNQLGTGLLVLTMTDVDKSNKSYYGETNLYYLSISGTFDCRVPLDKEGPIHDVAWGPNSKEFLVVYGSMPAKASLFNDRIEEIHDFGINPRNFVSFNPQGTTICTAGFGNLNGTVDFWDRKTLKKTNTFAASNASHCEWSPCGQFLLTATLTPRLRVDNGFKLWHRTGTLIYEEAIEELYQVRYRPEPAKRYPTRSNSPPPNPIKILPTVGGAAKSSAVPTGAYRPPHLRGSATPTSLSERAAALEGVGKSSTQRNVVGSKGSNTRKSPKGSDKGGDKSNEKGKLNPASPAQPDITPEEKQKKIRNLEKKLRQIRELKERLNKGESLAPAQEEKVTTEVEVMRELANLNV